MVVRPDPRCTGAARRLKAQGLYAEVVTIIAVLPNRGELVAKRPDGKRKTFTITNPALLARLSDELGKPGRLPSPAVFYALTRAELATSNFFVWQPGEGAPNAERVAASRNRRPNRLRLRDGDRGRPTRAARPVRDVPLPGL